MKKLLVPICILIVALLILGACTPAPTSTTPVQTQPSPTGTQPKPTSTATVTPEKPIELTFAYWAASQAAISKHLWNWWPKLVEQATSGRVKINIKGDASMGAPPAHYDLCKSGRADIANISTGFTPGQFPLSEIIGLPMMFPDSEVAATAMHRLTEKYLLDKEFKDVKFLGIMPPGNNELLTKKPVKVLEDFKGMKMIATEPLEVKTLTALGAAPVMMPRGETYTSLERGLADGIMANPMGSIMFKDIEVTKYRTYGVKIALNGSVMIMNWDSWKKLPPDIQNIMTGLTGLGFSQLGGMTFDVVQAQMLQQVIAYDKKVGNPEPYYLPAEERARWIEAVKPVIDAWVKEKDAAGLPASAALADLRGWVEEYSKAFLP